MTRAVALLGLAAAAGCRAEGKAVRPGPERPLSVPAPFDEPPCADVRSARVCWGGGRPELRPRPAPPFRARTPMGFRCTGGGAERRCADRTRGAGAFRCDGARCEQRVPRRPDAGEWECADDAGAVLCHGGAPPAGVAPAGADSGWLCGSRRGAPFDRVCVDLAPDFPDERPGWRCRFEPEGGGLRVCERDENARLLGDACDASRPCVDGALCVGGRCVPPRPAPACVLDRDCGAGACRFGSCREADG